MKTSAKALVYLLPLLGCTPHAAPTTTVRAPMHAAAVSPIQTEKPAAVTAQPHDELDPGDDSDEPIEDGPEQEATDQAETAPLVVSPLEGMSEDQIRERAKSDLASLGSLSIGATNGGRLLNGEQMVSTNCWQVLDPAHAWGTEETLRSLEVSIRKVCETIPDTPRLQIGHISGRKGGRLSPHVSHQSGRDVDVGYYYTNEARWFTRAHKGNLDVVRTWALVKALVVHSDVEMILIDHSIQRLLREHAEGRGEDQAWVRGLFAGEPGKYPPMIRHARGHANHIHIRFYSPVARETARRVARYLERSNAPDAPIHYVLHRAKSGDTLGSLARRYQTTVEAIRQANGLRSMAIRAKRTYRIPTAKPPKAPAVIAPESKPVRIPPRRLPPAAGGAAA